VRETGRILFILTTKPPATMIIFIYGRSNQVPCKQPSDFMPTIIY